MGNVKRYYWNADSIDGVGYGSMDFLADASSQELVDASDYDAALAREASLQERLNTADQRAAHWRGVSSEATCRAASLDERVGELVNLLRKVAEDAGIEFILGADTWALITKAIEGDKS